MIGSKMEKLMNYLPSLRSPWWTAILGLSLMANLLVAGVLIGRATHSRGFENGGRANFAQLVPRRFFADLDNSRRRELMQVMRDDHEEMRNLRKSFQASALKLADALELENYDAASVKAVIENFTTGSESLAARGGSAVEDLIAKLNPAERKQLASAIRDKQNQNQNQNKD